MGIKNNMSEQTNKEKGKWQITLFVANAKEAHLIAESEHLPAPNEYFNNYPTVVILPTMFTFFQILKKAKTFSSMGIYSKVTKLG